MPFIDFTALKSDVRIEDVAAMLSLNAANAGGQLRAPCPACRSGGDRALVITPAKQAFYCFAARMGGDLIALVAHVHGVAVKDAAQEIARHFGRNSTRNSTSSGNCTVPPGETGRPRRHGGSGPVRDRALTRVIPRREGAARASKDGRNDLIRRRPSRPPLCGGTG